MRHERKRNIYGNRRPGTSVQTSKEKSHRSKFLGGANLQKYHHDVERRIEE